MTAVPPRILAVFGTRPEAIKLAPVLQCLKRSTDVDLRVCLTAQHREMVDSVLELFAIRPDHDLGVMGEGEGLTYLTSAMLTRLEQVLKDWRPDRVLVQGDTTTTFAASLAAHYQRIPVAHIEAGLRTGNLHAPWPEEANRRLTAVLADLHFAPTEAARRNLLQEGVPPERIHVTGNTGIDALHRIVERLASDPALRRRIDKDFEFLDRGKRLILVTGHRRESLGQGLERICESLVRLSGRGDLQIVYPVHLNPRVRVTVEQRLAGSSNIRLLEPLDYLRFCYLLQRSHLVLTDSGGIQEEAPSLGKPVLVMRQVTEREEALLAGTAKLVGTDPETIVAESERLLDDAQAYQAMSSVHNPFGDGRASARICTILLAAAGLPHQGVGEAGPGSELTLPEPPVQALELSA